MFAVMIAVWPTSGTNNRLVVKPSGTRDKVNKSGTVPEIPGQMEPMLFALQYNTYIDEDMADMINYYDR